MVLRESVCVCKAHAVSCLLRNAANADRRDEQQQQQAKGREQESQDWTASYSLSILFPFAHRVPLVVVAASWFS